MNLLSLISRRTTPKSDRLSDSVLILLGMTVVQRFIGFARSVLFCVWLSAEELGQWDLAFGFLTLAVPIAVLSLPGCFGRYVAFYRQHGELRTFLRRTLAVTSALALLAAVVVTWRQEWFARLIFGRPEHTDLVPVLAFALVSLVAYSVATELLVALRMQRLASGLELLNTALFAGFGALLVGVCQAGASGVVAAYGAACVLAALTSLCWLGPWWRALPNGPAQAAVPVAIWSKVLPFAAALWISNAVDNLFGIVDRYILMHYSGLGASESLSMIGEYHSSRLLPMLLVNVAGLLAATSLPFFSRDWETGARTNVSRRLNLLLKLSGIGFVAVATAIVFLSPLLFGWLLRGKFQAAPAILSLTLAYACWSGLVCLAKGYLWCAEKAALVSVAYAVGLSVNVGLNLMLAPRFGVYGIAYGTCLSQVVLMLLVYGLSRAHGFELSRGTWLISALPLLLWFGPWWATAGLLAVCLLGINNERILNDAEKREIVAALARYRAAAAGWALAGDWPPLGQSVARVTHEPHPSGARPIRVMFVNTSLFVGGAEALQAELIRGIDRGRFAPEICCLKDAGPLAPRIAADVPVFHGLIRYKYDLAVVIRLMRLFRRRQIDVVVTVGAGDRMFWGRLAAWLAGVPVIASWLHSTGWPDTIGVLNRLLTPITDGFIAVARAHGRFLVERERLPANRVHVVRNGVDAERFRPRIGQHELRAALRLPRAAPVAGIVARLSPEKNHELFLKAAALVLKEVGEAHFLVIGDGPRLDRLTALSAEFGLTDRVHFLRDRTDVPELLALMDVFLLTSHVEANPISILEALATGKPVVATRVGSVSETVTDGEVGFLVEPGDGDAIAARVVELMRDPRLARRLGGEARRQVLDRHSLRGTVDQFQNLLQHLFANKAGARADIDQPDVEAPIQPVSMPLTSGG